MTHALVGKRLTYQVPLPGGQSRLREIILYVAGRSADAPRFGKIKLHKIIWLADFTAFAERRLPVTGRAYQRLEFGPAPVEMAPVLEELQQDGLLSFEEVDFGDDIVEKRPIALLPPNLKRFSRDDLDFVDRSIKHYWHMTGKETSDHSHGVAWRTRKNNDPMPYELAFLLDEKPEAEATKRILDLAKSKGWQSK